MRYVGFVFGFFYLSDLESNVCSQNYKDFSNNDPLPNNKMIKQL